MSVSSLTNEKMVAWKAHNTTVCYCVIVAAFVWKAEPQLRHCGGKSTDIHMCVVCYNRITYIHDPTMGSSWCDVLSSQLPTISNCSCFHWQECCHILLHLNVLINTWIKPLLFELSEKCSGSAYYPEPCGMWNVSFHWGEQRKWKKHLNAERANNQIIIPSDDDCAFRFKADKRGKTGRPSPRQHNRAEISQGHEAD